MPFRSEKQRRFLWAEHPDIARRWAHEYKNKKKLPMYVNDAKTDTKAPTKAAHVNTMLQTPQSALNTLKPLPIHEIDALTVKIADSVLKRVHLPESTKPTYAGQSDVPKTSTPTTSCAKVDGDEMTAKALLSKLAVVLSPKILQEMEEQQALAEAREAQRVAQNVNLKQYPVNTNPTIPPPMGMTAPPAPAQPAQPAQPQQAQSTMAPVGGGSSPMANPINSFGALSMDGNINGNAAFGAKNSPDSSKIAAAITKWAKASTPCSCGCGDTVATCKCSADCKCLKPGGSCYTAEKTAGLFDFLQPSPEVLAEREHNRQLYAMHQQVLQQMAEHRKQNHSQAKLDQIYERAMAPLYQKQMEFMYSRPEKTAGLFDFLTPKAAPTDWNPPTSPRYDLHADDSDWDAYEKQKQQFRQSLRKYLKTKGYSNIQQHHYEPSGTPWSMRGPDKKYHEIWMPDIDGEPVAKPVPLADVYDADTPGKAYRKGPGLLRVDLHKTAGSPAWQRAAGKNDEGGLNAKGRASYNRATGGNLKAPVTESNPTGDRAKRQNSFCSRMCGMKKHETGSKTKKDPDSRINKSLRKWNCKCSAAYEFGKAAAKAVPMNPIERATRLLVRQYMHKLVPPAGQPTSAVKPSAPIMQ